MSYYRIQFAPYDYFKKNYLSYRSGVGFTYSGRASASIFSDDMLKDHNLIDFLKEKEYQFEETDDDHDIFGIFCYRGIIK